MTEAQRAKEEAIERVARGREAYVRKAVLAGKKHLLTNSTVHSQLIRRLCPLPEGMEPRVLGTVMRRLVKDQGLAFIGYRSTNDRRSHCRPIAIWGRNGRTD